MRGACPINRVALISLDRSRLFWFCFRSNFIQILWLFLRFNAWTIQSFNHFSSAYYDLGPESTIVHPSAGKEPCARLIPLGAGFGLAVFVDSLMGVNFVLIYW